MCGTSKNLGITSMFISIENALKNWNISCIMMLSFLLNVHFVLIYFSKCKRIKEKWRAAYMLQALKHWYHLKTSMKGSRYNVLKSWISCRNIMQRYYYYILYTFDTIKVAICSYQFFNPTKNGVSILSLILAGCTKHEKRSYKLSCVPAYNVQN